MQHSIDQTKKKETNKTERNDVVNFVINLLFILGATGGRVVGAVKTGGRRWQSD